MGLLRKTRRGKSLISVHSSNLWMPILIWNPNIVGRFAPSDTSTDYSTDWREIVQRLGWLVVMQPIGTSSRLLYRNEERGMVIDPTFPHNVKP